MRRVKYLNNRDLLIEIHKSKNSYSSYIQDDCSTFDIIVPSLSKINVRTIAFAKKNKAKKLTQVAWETAKIGGQKKIKLTDFTISPRKINKLDLVFRVMMFDHVPKDAKRKRNPKTVADHHTKCNFPPFQHYKLDKKGKLICVGKSHWVGGMSNGHFNCHHGQITTTLARMYMKLCERYGTRANWRGYTYNDEMQSQALMQLSQIGLQFDESKSENPFAYYTAAITNSFTRILNIEKKNQNIRDDLLEQEHMMPSSTRQAEGQHSSPTYKKRMKTAHGPVKTVNKTGIIKLNRALRKKGELKKDDFDSVGYKDVDMSKHKPPEKKKWK